MKKLVKSATLVGGTEMAMVVVAIIRNKYLAITIGPEGFGMYSLLSSFFSFIAVFGGIWLATPTMKYISEYNSNKDTESVQKVFDFSFVILFFVSTIITILLFVFAKTVKSNFLTPNIIFLHYALFAASFISTSLVSVFRSLLQAYKLVKKVVMIRIISSLFNLVTLIILVYFFNLTGFFINILVSSVFLLLLYWKYGKNIVKIRLIKINFKDKILKKVLSFGGVNILLGFINLLSEYLLRLVIISFKSMSFLGLFQASYGIIRYLGVVSNGINFYYTPKMSENMDIIERNRVLNDYLRIILMSGILISTNTILYGGIVVQLLYSKSFLPLSEVIYIFVIAQFLGTIQSAFSEIVVGMAKLKIHSIVTLISHSLVLIIPFLFLKNIGLLAIGLGYVIASIFHIFINFTFLTFNIGIKVETRNIILILTSIIFISIAVIVKDKIIYFKSVITIVFGIYLFFNLKKNEKLFALNYLKKSFKYF